MKVRDGHVHTKYHVALKWKERERERERENERENERERERERERGRSFIYPRLNGIS